MFATTFISLDLSTAFLLIHSFPPSFLKFCYRYKRCHDGVFYLKIHFLIFLSTFSTATCGKLLYKSEGRFNQFCAQLYFLFQSYEQSYPQFSTRNYNCTSIVLPPKSLSLIFELTLNSPKLIYVLAHLLLPHRKLGSATKYFWQNPVCKLTTYWISTSFPIDNKYRYFSLTGLPRILLNACAYRLTWPWYRSITFWIPCCGLPGSTKSVL